MSTTEATPTSGPRDRRPRAEDRPRLRGVSHEVAFFVSLVTGPLLVAMAPAGARFPVVVYALSMSALFGVSALYHRRSWRWSANAHRWMRRLDHSTIFVFIAGTYTVVAGLTLSAPLVTVVLSVVWGGAIAGVVFKLVWIDAPKWLVAAMYVVLGWVAVIALPALWSALGVGGFALVVAGGLSYSAGALVYARHRPNPWPRMFGYHEVFHGLVILAAVCHYLAVAIYVLPDA
ncbi:MAG: hemolysin III family protein [Acidimicrobiales bacterium]|nr:hemolysin III family protein [Acidimicrobiales bacterium]